MTVKDVVESIHIVVETAAIILGGVWAWRAFFRRRLRFPRVCLKHAVTYRRFGSSNHLIHVSLLVENRGEVLLRIRSIIVWLHQVLPEPVDVLQAVEAGANPVLGEEREVRWPLLAEKTITLTDGTHEIEPGETERIECDFFIPNYVRTIEIYSHIKNDSKRRREIGWTETTFHDLSAASIHSHEEHFEAGSTTKRTTAAGEAETRSEPATPQDNTTAETRSNASSTNNLAVSAEEVIAEAP
jgi:hypothetical protein